MNLNGSLLYRTKDGIKLSKTSEMKKLGYNKRIEFFKFKINFHYFRENYLKFL